MPLLHRPRRAWIAALLLCFTFTQGHAQDGDPRKSTALRLAPADSSLFSTSVRLKERAQWAWKTKAVQEAWNTPLVQAGWAEVVKKWDEQGGPVREALKKKENQEALQLLVDMASEEVFFLCGPNTPRFFGALGKTFNAAQSNPFLPLFGGDAGGPFTQFRQMLRELQGSKADLVTPDLVIGFKIKDRKVAVRQVARLEVLLNVAAMAVPQMTGKVKHQKINGFDFGTVSLDGSLVPWDQVPWDSIEEKEGEFTPLVEHLKKLKLTICLGTYEDYLIIALGESTAVVERLGKGKKLGELPEFALLDRHQGKPLHAVSYTAKGMGGGGFMQGDVNRLKSQFKKGIEETEGLSADQKKRLARDMEELVTDIASLGGTHEPGASLAVSFGSDRGQETFSYQFSVDPQVDSGKPLALLAHAGGSPVAAFAGRYTANPAGWDFVVKWGKKAEVYFREFAVPKMSEDQQKVALKILEGLYPLFKRFDRTTRENVLPALADGQLALVVDNKLHSKQWHRSMPAAKNPLPLLEPALVFGITDADKLQKGMGDYRSIVNDAIKVLRDHEVPVEDQVSWPAPKVQKAGDATLYFYSFPDELEIDGRLTPTGAVGKNLAALTVSNEHALRLMTARPLQAGGGPLAESNRPLGGACYFKVSALLDTAMPWVDYVLELPDVKEKAEQHARDIKKIISALRIFEQYSSATYVEGKMTVTHGEWVIKDVK